MSGVDAIVSRSLTRRFGNLVAVDDLDLTVPRGIIFGFLGPNGCGKSTTIRMLCGLLTPSAGEANVLGIEVPRDAEALRYKIGYMTQKFSLYDDLSVTENLQFLAQVYSLPRKSRGQRVAAQISRFGLGASAAQRAGTMSGGQRQRLALAGATLHEPELLFLDEPTSAVDPESRREFWEFLFEMVDRGTTILVSTHFMDEAERCHQIAILDQGRLVAHGEPVALMRDIGSQVVEIESVDTRAVRNKLIDAEFVWHVSQLGSRLHALLDPGVAQPIASLEQLTAGVDPDIRLDLVAANLEDVFVMATGNR